MTPAADRPPEGAPAAERPAVPARPVVATLVVTAVLLAVTYAGLLHPLLAAGTVTAGTVPAGTDAPAPLGALVRVGWALTAVLAPVVALAGLVVGTAATAALVRGGRPALAWPAGLAALVHGAVLVTAASPWGRAAAEAALG